MKTIIDCETNEVIERELNAAEIKQQKIDEAAITAQIEAEAEEVAAKAEAKAELLTKLGITAEEAALLFA